MRINESYLHNLAAEELAIYNNENPYRQEFLNDKAESCLNKRFKHTAEKRLFGPEQPLPV